jgi:hypothetical protein
MPHVGFLVAKTRVRWGGSCVRKDAGWYQSRLLRKRGGGPDTAARLAVWYYARGRGDARVW